MVFRKTAINHGGLWYQNAFIWSFLMFWQPLSCQLYHFMTLYRLRNSKVSKVVKITVFKRVQVCGKTTYGFKAVYTVFEWCYTLVPFFLERAYQNWPPKNFSWWLEVRHRLPWYDSTAKSQIFQILTDIAS